MNCIFELQEQYLMSERSERVRYCSCNSNIKFISSRHREIFSMIVADPECKLFDKRFYFPHRIPVTFLKDMRKKRSHIKIAASNLLQMRNIIVIYYSCHHHYHHP